MRTAHNLVSNPRRPRSIVLPLFLLSCALCGCSSVRPELTHEEQVYSEQLKLQNRTLTPWWEYPLAPLGWAAAVAGSPFFGGE